MVRKSLIVLLLMVLLPIFSSCQTKSDIIIGFSGQITGATSQLGIDSMYGAQFAVSKINEAGGVNGRMLKLEIRDDEGDPTKAVAVDNELKDAGAVAIIGHGLSKVSASIVANANENDILLISPTISTNALTGIDDNFLRVIPANDKQGAELAHLVATGNSDDLLIAFESTNIAYTGDLVDKFEDTYETLGLVHTEEHHHAFESGNNDDYLYVADKINNFDAEAVVLIGSSYDVSTIMQLVDDVSLYTFYMPVWPTTKDVFQLSGDSIDKAYGINYFNPDSTNTDLETLNEAFTAQFGQPISFSALMTYEAVYILYEALLHTEDHSIDGIKEAIIEIEDFEGVLDEISIDEYGDMDRKMLWLRLDNESDRFIEIDNETN